MCGIAGGYWRNPAVNLERRVKGALGALRRRGPDDNGSESISLETGLVALGHTRLSIIDLSPGGHQPMESVDGRFMIVFNGEIYNYRELRSELDQLGHQFKTDSDTEVLLAAWRQWEKECLTKLVGMFAFVVVDREQMQLTCVRDPFGIKPLFYSHCDGEFLFASEIGAIKELANGELKLNWQRAYDYLVHGDYDSSDSTMFDRVSHLLPAHWIDVDLNSGIANTPVCWWQPTIAERSDISFADAADELRQRFLDNVALHLRSDVPIGAALSGGVDSSAVVCAMRHLEPDLQIRTFSYIAQGSALSEETWIDRINDHVRADPFKVVASAEEMGHDLAEMIKVQGEPFGSTSIYAQYRVFQLARQHGVTVTLDGQGADELLAGYAGYPGPRLRSLLETGHPIQALKFLYRWAQWPGRSLVDGTKYLARELTSGSLYQMLRWMHGRSAIPSWIHRDQATERGVTLQHPPYRTGIRHPRGRSVAAALATALTRKGLTKLLRHGDRNSMRFSVESRVPFLTAGLADFLLSLPESYLISPDGETKRVFRAAMRGIVPDEILDRKDKIGFATPESDWMRQTLPSIAAAEDFDEIPLIDAAAMKSDLQLVIDGKKRFEPQIWRRVCFTQWYRLFFLQSKIHSAAA